MEAAVSGEEYDVENGATGRKIVVDWGFLLSKAEARGTTWDKSPSPASRLLLDLTPYCYIAFPMSPTDPTDLGPLFIEPFQVCD